MNVALARLPAARLLRTPRTLLALGAWCALGAGFAVLVRSHCSAHGADDALVGAFGALVLPLLAYSVVGGALGAGSLGRSSAALVSLGATPTRAAMACIAVATGTSALLGALLAAAVAAMAHGVADPPRAHDALVSAYAGALGGASYAAWFCLGASFGRRGGGRAALLLVDWAMASVGGVLAAGCPRGHVRNLLGGAPPEDLSERASAALLVLLGIVCALWAVRRVQRRSG